jgi:hypothetical protein
MGNDYIFFDEALRDRFTQYLAQHGVASQSRADTMEGFVVALDGEPGEDVLDEVEDLYEALMDEQMLLASSRPGWVTHQVAGVTITRADGSTCVVRLPADVARPLLEHFTAQQAHDLVQAIASSLENPVNGPLCKRPA